MSLRIGQGIDRHRLVEGRPLILGGVRIASQRGLLGHSDADALTHAICDALLGALALGDLGQRFPDTDEAHRGRDSQEFLAEIVQEVRERGFEPVNLDCTVMAEAPRLAPHLAAMRARLAQTLAVSADRISIKATRGEGLGPEGRGEGVTAYAVVLVESAEGKGQ